MQANDKAVTIPLLQQMKRDGKKIVAVVAWDNQVAKIVDRAGVEIVSVGDTVGINLLGHANPLEITMEEMLMITKAVRRGVKRALVSADFPYGPLQEGTDAALRAAIRFVKEAGVDIIKVDGAADFPDAVSAIARAGIPVWAQIGITPQTALHYGVDYAQMLKGDVQMPAEMTAELVAQVKMLEEAGASLIDFTNSGPIAGDAVTKAATVPVIGGLGGGPWLDGRVRMAHAAIGYAESWIDSKAECYANVAKITLDSINAYADDVRNSRQIKGGIKIKAA